MIKISVIIPVFNAEKYLTRCIDSLLSQSYKNFELLLVNDGSTDNSGEICNKYAHNDNRVVVIHKDNGGASSARNEGIEKSVGEYICFVDSDDYVDNDYLYNFMKVEYLNIDKSVFIIQGLKYEMSGNITKYIHFKEGIYNHDNFSELITDNKIMFYGYPFCKLYYKQILEKYSVRFNEKIHFSEDLLFMLEYLKYIKNVKTLNTHDYHYCIDSFNSLSKLHNSFESEYLCFKLIKQEIDKNKIAHNLNKIAASEVYFFINKFLWRSINSMYRVNKKLNRKMRLFNLNIIFSDHSEYIKFYPKKGVHYFEKISCFFFNKKLFNFFDAYQSLIFYLRYKYQKKWLQLRVIILKKI